MPAPIMPINDAIVLAKVIGNTDLIIALQNYRSIMSDALEVVESQCEAVLEFMDDRSLQDSEDDTLTQSEQDAWIGLSEALGYDYPIPDWYKELWI